jgi:AraC-like DNA-binding protein/mannose-6-phosphate isomerase-like protein (cupin superfamily)
MKDFQPLFLQDLNIHLQQLSVRRLQLNRHLKELKSVDQHEHDFSQILLYLGGRGLQLVDGQGYPVRAGSILWFEPGLPHAFKEQQGLRPLCLVLDLELQGGGYRPQRLGQLRPGELAEVKQLLSRLMQTRDDFGQVRQAGVVLLVLDILLRNIGWLAPSHSTLAPPIVRRVYSILEDPAARALPLSQIAHRAGYQRDHLNRLLKRASGSSLGHLRDQLRVKQAQRLLTQALKVQDVAERLGFADQNYFARWFRQQTGLRPTQWRVQSIALANK